MFEKLSITACEDVTVRDLLRLNKAGHCVQRSSHAGNWSLYKLLLSELGLPDCIWDVTCIYKDINNQPKHQLIGGEKINLLGTKDPGVPTATVKYLTPYFRTENHGEGTLSHFHVAPLKKLFGSIITTQSEVLLEYKENMQAVFEVVEKYRPELLGRYVFPCGCMVPLYKSESGFRTRCKHNVIEIPQSKLAESAVSTLEELERLVFDPFGYEAKGGVIYSLELVVASFYLWAYWKFGDKTVYELSGPDMSGYATKPDFIRRIFKVLELLERELPSLVPKRIEAKIVPAIYFRFGYPNTCKISEKVMRAHQAVYEIQKLKHRSKDIPDISNALEDSLRGILPVIDRNGKDWDLYHKPDKDAFYSQHDMVKSGARMVVQEEFLDLPFKTLGNILRTLPQIEDSLKRKLSYKNSLGSNERVQSAFGPEDSFL